MDNRKWYSIDAKGAVPVLYIYDQIGSFGVTAKDFARDLALLGNLKGKALTVRINSPGGDVFMGNSMYNLLRESGAVITVNIDGVAASMASLIAMAGHKVIMAENAMMMIHNPSALAAGTSDEMTKMASLLDALTAGMVSAYSSKSGLGREAVAKIMDEETWLDAEQAVAAGFADEIGASLAVAAFDLTHYKRPPTPVAVNKEVLDMDETKLAALMAANNATLLSGIGSAIADALKPAVVTAAKPTEPGAKSEDDLRKEIKDGIKAYTAEVNGLCALAGFPAEAAAFIAAETPVAEVRTKLMAKKAEKPTAGKPGNGINNHAPINVDGSPNGEQEEDISDLVPKPEASSVVWNRFNGKSRRA